MKKMVGSKNTLSVLTIYCCITMKILWHKTIYIYYLTDSMGSNYSHGLTGASASGSHRLQARCQPGLGSPLGLTGEGSAFKFTRLSATLSFCRLLD